MHIPPRLARKLKHLTRKNVVSHGTYVTDSPAKRGRVYGTYKKVSIMPCDALSCHSISKFGSATCHYRINTEPASLNYGKFLVFKSSNMIRAGKYTHAMAMRNFILFSKWVRNVSKQPVHWHTAMAAPNMVISGSLNDKLPACVWEHWSATHSCKFPGVSIATDATCTPEMYASGAFIIPGVTSVRSLNIALKAIDAAVHGDAHLD